MSQPNAYEQYLLELINTERAVADAQPLAFNLDLNEAAEGHTSWMIANDTFTHAGADGSTPKQRMIDAGYSFSGTWAEGENIWWVSNDATAGFQSEVASLHASLMDSPGHRANILNGSFREIGVGFETGELFGWDASAVTENFALSGSDVFLTGVAFDDQDGDRSYDVDEGLGGLKITAENAAGQTFTETTMNAGGYGLALEAGTYTVTFSGDGIAASTHQVTIRGDNVKLDLVDPKTDEPGQDPIDGTSADDRLQGTSKADLLRGFGGSDRLDGQAGNDTLLGGDGDDTIAGGSGDDFISGGNGLDEMSGGDGADTFYFGSAGQAPFNQFAGDGITDFSGFDLQGDVIDLSDVFEGTLTFLGTGNFTETAGEVRVQDFRDPGTGAGVQQIRVDLNGDAVADMGIVVDYQGSFNVQEEDFVL